MTRMLIRILRRLARALGFHLHRSDDAHVYAPKKLVRDEPARWGLPTDDEAFDEVATAAIEGGRTLLRYDRLYVLWQAVQNAGGQGLAAAEVGAYRGGSSWFIALAHRRIHNADVRLRVFDTFEGHPLGGPREDIEPEHVVGMFSDTSVEAVEQYLRKFPSVVLHAGEFPDSLRNVPDERYGMVHLDVDTYTATRAALEYFLPRLAPSGVIVLDDYNAPACPGVRRAVSEVLGDRHDVGLWHPMTEQLVLVRRTPATPMLHVLTVVRSLKHLTYIETILEELLGRGHRITLLFDEEWSRPGNLDQVQSLRDRFPSLTVGWSQRRRGWTRKPTFVLRELRSYANYLRHPEQSPFYMQRWQKYLPRRVQPLVERGFVRWLLLTRITSGLLRLLEALVPADRSIMAELRTLSPDVVVVTPANMRFDEEIEYVKAAKRLRIRTAVPVLSWDNLTTKGLIHVRPSLMLAWNEAHAREAIDFHGMPRDRVLITGSPFFDKWFDDPIEPEERSSFLKRVGLNPDVPYLLYLGSSRNIARDESWVIEQLLERMTASDVEAVNCASILVRPHPANADVYEGLVGERIAVWPPGGTLPESGPARRDMVTSFVNAAAAFGINTSGMIDAVVLGVPTITLLLDEYRDTQQGAIHFQHLADTGAVDVTRSFDESIARIEQDFLGLDPTASIRERFVREFIRPAPGASAGSVAADALERLARGLAPERVVVAPRMSR